MKIKKIKLAFCMTIFSVISPQEVLSVGTSVMTNNGQTITLTLPVKATITADSILRDAILVKPLSSLYDIVTWDSENNRFKNHEFLVRVIKETAVPISFEVINDQYTCGYNNPDRMSPLPIDIAIANSDYKYSVSWSGGYVNMEKGRAAIVNDSHSWRSSVNGVDRYLDLTLNINFPDMTPYTQLLNRGGICRGSITMLLSNKL